MNEQVIEEKIIRTKNGGKMLLALIAVSLACIAGIIYVPVKYGDNMGALQIATIIILPIIMLAALIAMAGLKIVEPQEAYVYVLFGKYYGTIREYGFYYINPFCTSFNPAARTKLSQSGDIKSNKVQIANGATQANIDVGMTKNTISLKIMTLSNNKQKINDLLGNPVEISIAVLWRVVDPCKAVFNVDNYKEFLSLQCDASLREIVKKYPYDITVGVDTTGDGIPDEGSLRGSSKEVADKIKEEIQSTVTSAGIEITEARITYLAYSPEIASAMLQRQQASAIVDARKLIVEGSVSIVEMALEKLEASSKVELDAERKAAMVSNLLVVLCGNKEAQPIVNSGSLY